MEARADLNLIRAAIPTAGRYYDAQRTIVMRKGLLLREERRYLWHELVHADRRDTACDNSESIEASVEREAVRRAIPLESLTWAVHQASHWLEVAERLKLPQEWVEFRWRTAHPSEKGHVRRHACAAF